MKMKLNSNMKWLMSGFALVLFYPMAHAAPKAGTSGAGVPVIDIPAHGWRNSSMEKVEFSQEVHYPASNVNMSDTSKVASMIRGHIQGAPKKGQQGAKSDRNRRHQGGSDEIKHAPLKLIVNGADMPLSTDGQTFIRPYVFGPGSNGVEVRSADGKDRARTQFFESGGGALAPKLTVLLSWDTDNTDLDLHLITPDGKHCWYGNRVLDNGAVLDVDVTTGYGPEMISSTSPESGLYLVYLNYYGSGGGSDLTVAKVTVIYNQNTLDERRETMTIPMRKAGDMVLAHSFRLK